MLLASGISDVTSNGPYAAVTPSTVKLLVAVTYAVSKSGPAPRRCSSTREALTRVSSGWYTRYAPTAKPTPPYVTLSHVEFVAPTAVTVQPPTATDALIPPPPPVATVQALGVTAVSGNAARFVLK